MPNYWTLTDDRVCVCVGGGAPELQLFTLYVKQSKRKDSSIVAARRESLDPRLHVESFYTGMGDRLRAGIPPWYVTKPSRATQLCIPPGLLNRVPALVGVKEGMSPLPGGR